MSGLNKHLYCVRALTPPGLTALAEHGWQITSPLCTPQLGVILSPQTDNSILLVPLFSSSSYHLIHQTISVSDTQLHYPTSVCAYACLRAVHVCEQNMYVNSTWMCEQWACVSAVYVCVWAEHVCEQYMCVISTCEQNMCVSSTCVRAEHVWAVMCVSRTCVWAVCVWAVCVSMCESSTNVCESRTCVWSVHVWVEHVREQQCVWAYQ